MKANGLAKTRLKEICGLLANGYEYPDELDALGRESGEYSQVAIVYADGEGMGGRLNDISKQPCTPDDEESYASANRQDVNAPRSFSQSVEEAAQFDAIEMADWYIPIEKAQAEGAQPNAD